MFEKILDYATNSEDPDMFDFLEIEYQDIINSAKAFHKKIEELFNRLKLKI